MSRFSNNSIYSRSSPSSEEKTDALRHSAVLGVIRLQSAVRGTGEASDSWLLSLHTLWVEGT